MPVSPHIQRATRCNFALSPEVQLQLLALDLHHLLLEGSLSLQLALYPPQHCQFLPLETHHLMGLITTWIHLLAVITHTRAHSLIAHVCGDHRALCGIYALIKWWVIDLPGIN